MTSARRLLERMARSSDPVLAAEAQKEIDKRDAAKRASRARTAPRRKAGAAEKKAKRDERADRTANVRVEVFKRDEGRCVVCGTEATEMHHLVYGSGWRRILEGMKTCAALCRWHHVEAHRGGRATLEFLQVWARARGYTLAAEALVRRLDKQTAALGSSVRRAEGAR